MKRDYAALAKVYHFLTQVKMNSQECDAGRPDASTHRQRLNNVLAQLRTLMCTLDVYMRSAGDPMEVSDIPSFDDTVPGSEPAVDSLCSSTTSQMKRDGVEYVVVRDSVSVLYQLKSQYNWMLDYLQTSS